MPHSSTKPEKILPDHYQVLILDNNEGIAELLGMHLQEMNHHQYDLSFSLKDAKERIEKKEYDLLLLDWNLDDGTCFSLIDKIKTMDKLKHPRLTSALIIIITGRDSAEDKKKLEKYNIHAHFIKPFVREDFEKSINAALKKHLGKS